MTANVLYGYVRRKRKVQDKIGHLEGRDVNIITGGFLMEET